VDGDLKSPQHRDHMPTDAERVRITVELQAIKADISRALAEIEAARTVRLRELAQWRCR
jgi:hypothetical protein